jgi:transketolase
MTGPHPVEPEDYGKLAKTVRKDILSMISRAKAPHIGSAFSVVDILTVLYFRTLNVSPDNPRAEGRDRFILSKGHGCAALYATLANRGFIPFDTLKGFGADQGTLELHQSRNDSFGIEVSSGSLGHGLSIGNGMALAGKSDDSGYRVFVLMSDGECNEGSVWEAAMFAAHHRLDNLIAIVDYNKIQAFGKTEDIIDLEPFAYKWRSFGWSVREIDGHDIGAIVETFDCLPFEPGKPNLVLAHTIKGKGVSFMENNLLWHYRCPDEEEYELALKELD